MFKISKICTILCETPLHAGSGSDLGFVDLPIQREKHTEFPKIEGSSMKGAIRESFERRIGSQIPNLGEIKKESISLVFGPEGDPNQDAHSGAIAISDARLLLFPVKSMNGVYAYTTCRKVLSRFLSDFKLAYPNQGKIFDLPDEKTVTENPNILIPNQSKVVLEEYTLDVKKDNKTSKAADWIANELIPKDPEYDYIREKIKKDLIVLTDNDFKNFTNLSTEVITRTAIDSKTGTVKDKALFTEEYLPSESILYFLTFAGPVFNENKGIFQSAEKKEEELVMEFLTKGLPPAIQIGGNATLGKGLCRLQFIG